MARILLVSLFDEYALGLRYIAASLANQGHDVRLLFLKTLALLRDTPFEPGDTERIPETPLPVLKQEVELLVGEARAFDPDLIGISLVSNLFGLASAITRAFHNQLDAPVAWGGVDPTVNPDLAAEHAGVVCVGEGERAMVELASRLGPRGRSLERITEPIDNLKVKTGGGWLAGRLGVMEPDLDRLPFPRFDVTKETYITDGRVFRGVYPPGCRLLHHVPAISFRGCPYQCTYCCHSVLRKIYTGGKYLRRRSVGNFIAELRQRKAEFPGLRMIEIEDDVFTLDQRWIEAFAQEYGKQVGVPFWCYTYPGVSRESMLAPLKEAGLHSVTFGIQSGSRRVLEELYERPMKVESITETAEVLYRLGIPFVVDLIGSNPLETDADRIETVRVLTSLPKPYQLHRINPISFYHRYPLTDRAREVGAAIVKGHGANTYCPEPDPRFRAWDAIFNLAHHPGVESATLRPLWESDRLMNHPEHLERLAAALAEAAHYRGDIYETKDQRIEVEQAGAAALEGQLEGIRRELAELRGSRLIRLALGLRRLLHGSAPAADPE